MKKFTVWIDGKEVDAKVVKFVLVDDHVQIEVSAGHSEEGGGWLSQTTTDLHTGQIQFSQEVQ